MLYKASLYGFSAWTWSIFIMQQPGSDFRHLFQGLDWVLRVFEHWEPSDFCLFRVTSKCALISIQICHLKKIEPLTSKRGHSLAAVNWRESKHTQALPLLSSLTNYIFVLNNKIVSPSEEPSCIFLTSMGFLKFWFKEMQKSEACPVYSICTKSTTLPTK